MASCLPENRSQTVRDAFAREVTARGEASDPRIRAAFAAVRREDFAGPGPWVVSVSGHGMMPTPDDDVAHLYQDRLVAIDPARGINFGEPSLHARCLAAVAPQPGESVLHVGAGVGYYTAILAELVGSGGRVVGREIEADLAARAAQSLRPWPQAAVEARSGFEAPPSSDIIYVNAGLPRIPPEWLDALNVGGRLIMPLQPRGRVGVMLRVSRPPSGDAWPAEVVSPVSFISCRGGGDSVAERRLAEALERGGWNRIRSLHRGGEPDATLWLDDGGGWLSSAAP